ncbi:AAA family ATPase [Methylobacterium sp. Leaf108]|uniref:AAA family ATPase n=1 Tax=Methylobacterium sp. Leaf108 TaxID=1736256 RepID=UPI000AA7B5E6|nr:AAA family ATPase [Methylobacterium sp. Leaf108]
MFDSNIAASVQLDNSSDTHHHTARLTVPASDAFKQLWDLGYRHLVPVVPHDAVLSPTSHLAKRRGDARGKAPGQRGRGGEWFGLEKWQTNVPTLAEIKAWAAMDASVGLRLGLQADDKYLFAIDADTLDRPSAEIVSRLVEKRFGLVPVRIGQSPKALYLVRCRDALPYRSLAFEHGVVEVLGEGKQCVMVGVHRVTLKPYRITRPEGGLPPLADLPLHDSAEIDKLLIDLSAVLPKPERVYGEHGATNRALVNQERLKGDLELVRRAVEALPNRYPADGYAWWVKLAAAIRGACQEDDCVGLELFEDFTAKAELGKDASESATRVYRSINPPYAVGASLIYELAEERSGGKFDRTDLWFDHVAGAAASSGTEGEPATTPAAASDVFEVLSLGEIINRPPTRFIVSRHIPEGSLGFLYGAPSAGKSFVVLDLALHIAFGKPDWHGDAIESDPSACVLYLAGEGALGFRTRARAWAKRHGIPEAEIDSGRFKLLPVPVNMMRPGQIEKLVRTIRRSVGRVSLIVVDTVSRSMPGADENLQKEMTLFVEACDVLKRMFGCVVLGVHHANNQGRIRGSNVLPAGGDFVFKLTKTKGSAIRTLFCEKQKDGPDDWSDLYRFDVVDVEGGSSLVPFRHAIADIQVPDATPDLTARVLEAMAAAWAVREPWAKTNRARNGRYAGAQMARQFGIPVEKAEAMLKGWIAARVIAVEEYDTHGKREGYRVLTYTAPLEASAVPTGDVFS